MAFLVQDDDGSIAGATAYITAAYMKAYFLDRGVDLSAVLDATLQPFIVVATSYLDTRYTYASIRRNNTQTTQWPRRDAYDRDEYLITGVPTALKQACAELAQRARSADLWPDPVADDTGRVIMSKSEGVGPLQESVTYAAGAAYMLPEYPAVDRMLASAGLIRTGLTAVRA